ncbi:MAG: hypothetical protein HC853_00970 [Anaerolineae bacterium]|nr:hypothetical protein [Anaerolineae bacterium]
MTDTDKGITEAVSRVLPEMTPERRRHHRKSLSTPYTIAHCSLCCTYPVMSMQQRLTTALSPLSASGLFLALFSWFGIRYAKVTPFCAVITSEVALGTQALTTNLATKQLKTYAHDRSERLA